jgi:hypothetical protein
VPSQGLEWVIEARIAAYIDISTMNKPLDYSGELFPANIDVMLLTSNRFFHLRMAVFIPYRMKKF